MNLIRNLVSNGMKKISNGVKKGFLTGCTTGG